MKLRWLAAALLAALFLTACGDGLDTEKLGGVRTDEGEVYPERVLTLEGEAVSFDEFRYYYLNYRDQYAADKKIPLGTDEGEEALKNEVLENLLIKRASLLLAAEKGVALTAAEEKEAKKAVADSLSLYGKEALAESLHASYMSQQMYREMTLYAALYDKLYGTLYGEGGSEAWDDAAFLKYYKENYLAAQEIFLPYEKGETAGDCEKTRAAAEEIRAKVDAGEDFWKLVETYGEDPAMELEPDGYYFTKGEAEDVLYEAALALKENEVSLPVEAESGVYLIRRVAILEEKALRRKADVLSGYYDGAGEYHSGVYEEAFRQMLEEKAKSVSVEKDPIWDAIRSDTVF
ncbi:MAG: peptidylprolyl isomerase [Clostridia bacterium]|nr:peptidylprolyl isomerase [Clostridia bacterium]